MRQVNLTGALTDPCPVCSMKPAHGMNVHGENAEPEDGAVTVCFGCGLVQIIHDGMRCALTEDEADWLFSEEVLVAHIVAMSKMRAIAPWRTAEIVRGQH